MIVQTQVCESTAPAYERTSDAQLKAAGLAVSEQKPFFPECTDRDPLISLENTTVKEEEEVVEEKKHDPVCIVEKLEDRSSVHMEY